MNWNVKISQLHCGTDGKWGGCIRAFLFYSLVQNFYKIKEKKVLKENASLLAGDTDTRKEKEASESGV